MVEHEMISKVADEERKRRPDYKPLTEHDVFLRHQSYNEETNKMKTREEILAEERDYKRRRMSYRGKKSKRSTTEKMRDIIEVYMEEMKLASGIGCSAKGSEDKEALVSKTLLTHDNSADAYKPTKTLDYSCEPSRGRQHSNEKLLESCHNMRLVDRRESRSYHGHLISDGSIRIRKPQREEDNTRIPDERRSRRNGEDYSRSPDKRKSRRDREEYSRSPDKRKSRRDREDYSRSPDQRGRKIRRDREDYSRSPDQRVRKSRRDREDYSRSPDRRRRKRDSDDDDSRGLFSRRSNMRHGHQREERGEDSERKNKRRGKSPRNHRSASEFEDRYTPVG